MLKAEKVYLPDPSIRQESFYSAMYDAQGNLRESIPSGSGAQPPASDRPLPAPPAAPEEKTSGPQSTLAEAAATMNGKLHAKGTYYLPRPGADDFELDLSRHPMLEFGDGTRLIFTSSDRIMDMSREQFQAVWPKIKTVSVDEQADAEEIIGAVFDTLGKIETEAGEVAFDAQGVRVAVRAKWMRPETEGRHLCITPISDPDQQTPEAIRRFLEQNGIVLKEVLPGGASPSLQNEPRRHAVKNILALTPTGQKDFVQILATKPWWISATCTAMP
ncbi:MAG: hypothetical protein P8Z73_13605 [Desulfobacteraceae bacterium]